MCFGLKINTQIDMSADWKGGGVNINNVARQKNQTVLICGLEIRIKKMLLTWCYAKDKG